MKNKEIATVRKVMLVDGYQGERSAVRLLLDQEQGLEVVGETGRAGELLDKLGATRPDVLLLDWALPGLLAAVLLPTVHARYPDLTVVALSGRPELARQALEAGADVFVSKGEPPERLLEAIASREEKSSNSSR